MNEVNKTLYIPLYGKAAVSKKGIILQDKKAEQIWEKEGFALKGKAKSKWLTYYMGMRSAVFDNWVKTMLEAYPEAMVLHIGCGMDSRVERIGARNRIWYDVDFPDVIEERRKYYQEDEYYHMLLADARKTDWVKQLPCCNHIIVIMEGISMYLTHEELAHLLLTIKNYFQNVNLLVDCYTELAAKASKYKNPIKEVGASATSGLDDTTYLEKRAGLKFVAEHSLTPSEMVDELHGFERWFFKHVMAGSMAKKLYRLYEYNSGI